MIYDSEQTSTFIFMMNAINFNGGITEKYLFSLNSFEFNEQLITAKVLNTSRESEIRFFLDIDLTYSDHLHDAHSDYPLTPTKEVVSNCGSVSFNCSC